MPAIHFGSGCNTGEEGVGTANARETGKGWKTLPKERKWREMIEINARWVYTRKQNYMWFTTCQSQRIGGSKLPGEGKH